MDASRSNQVSTPPSNYENTSNCTSGIDTGANTVNVSDKVEHRLKKKKTCFRFRHNPQQRLQNPASTIQYPVVSTGRTTPDSDYGEEKIREEDNFNCPWIPNDRQYSLGSEG